MSKYILIYAWNLSNNTIFGPTIKEVFTKEIYELPYVKGYRLLKCYCSTNKEDVEKIKEDTWENFRKINIKSDAEIINHMVQLCDMQEEKIKREWDDSKWPMDDLPF